MKFTYLAVLAIMLSCACHRKLSNANGTNKTNNANAANKANEANAGKAVYLDTRGNPMLLGTHSIGDLRQAPYGDWFNKNYADYAVDSATADKLAPLLKDKTFELYLGTWCGDSKREVPRMLKILSYAGVQPWQVKLIMVDSHDSLYKQSPAHEEKGKDIHRVPDLLVYSNHRELNRIVEEPVVSLEKDLLRIALGEAYISSYPGAVYLSRQLKEKKTADKETLIAGLKPIAHSETDLNSLAWAWMHAGEEEKKKAVLALQINTVLYPNAPLGYDLLGDLYKQMNNKEEARKLYQKVLELQPGNTKTAQKLAQLE